MTKYACDICGAECERAPTMNVTMTLPEKKWSGTRSESASCVDGVWTPTFFAMMTFQSENLSQNDYRKSQPDLCKPCMIGIVKSLLHKYENGTPVASI